VHENDYQNILIIHKLRDFGLLTSVQIYCRLAFVHITALTLILKSVKNTFTLVNWFYTEMDLNNQPTWPNTIKLYIKYKSLFIGLQGEGYEERQLVFFTLL